jgi:predicted DCC family thiol-disulfide oxidoreductase YuxK
MEKPQAIIFFDDHCHLCCGSVQFILKRDPGGYFQYAPVDSETAKQVFANWDKKEPIPDSIILYEAGRFYTRSTASLRVARKLSGSWPLLYAWMIVPGFIRDAVYNLIARNRYKWFGRSETCWMPKAEWKGRFLD